MNTSEQVTLGHSFKSLFDIEKKFEIFDDDKFNAVIFPHFYI